MALRYWALPVTLGGLADGISAGVFVLLTGIGNFLGFRPVWMELLHAFTRAVHRPTAGRASKQFEAT
jgi:hypothetical protein